MPIALPRSAAALALLLATSASCQKNPDPDDTADEYLEDHSQGSGPPSCKWDGEPTPPKGMIAHGLSASILLDGAESCV